MGETTPDTQPATSNPIKHSLYILTYDRGTYSLTGKVKPYHWSYLIKRGNEGNEQSSSYFQLRGMPGGFYYPGPEHLSDVVMQQAGDVKDKLEVGEVNRADMDKMNDVLAGLEIVKDESSGWSCQDWALAGLAKLREEGIVYEHMTVEVVRSWLKER